MVDLGDQITNKFIRSVECPVHFNVPCWGWGGIHGSCRKRINKAILVLHSQRMRKLHNRCEACIEGSGYHVHFNM